jgi:hypothetical protein
MAKMQGESSPDAARAPNQVAPGPSPATEPSRLPRITRRFGLVHAAGLVVAIVAGIAVILIAMLPRPAPVLPPMSNSLGFWDRIPTPVVHQISPLSNDTESWDRVPPEAHLAAQTHAEATVEQAVPASMGAMGDAYVPSAKSEVMSNREPVAAPQQPAARSQSEALAYQQPEAASLDSARYGAIPLREAQAYQEPAAAPSVPPMSASQADADNVAAELKPSELPPTSSVMDFPERVPVVGGMRSYWDRPSASIAAAQSHLEMFRYTGQPALEEAHPATRSSLEIYRYTGEPALDDPGLASSTQPIRYPINVMR